MMKLKPLGDQISIPYLIAEQIRLMISNNVYKPGDQLLSEPELAKQLKVSRMSLREAIQLLILEGLLFRKRGVGTFVSSHISIENPLNRNTSVTEFILSKNAVPGTRDLEITSGLASKYVSTMLSIPENEEIIYIKRIRTASGQPVIYSKEHLSTTILKNRVSFTDIFSRIKKELEEKPSLYQVLEDVFDLKIEHATAKISALSADEFFADRLILNPGDCLIRLEQIDFDQNNTPIILSNEYYPGNSVFTVYRSR